MAYSASSMMEPSVEVDKLSYEIFSILETKFLFGFNDRPTIGSGSAGKIRILSVDAGGGGIPAALALARLESVLRKRSGDPSASLADFFDAAAGSGAGAVLAAALFSRRRPHLSAAAALRLLLSRRRRGIFRRIFRRSDGDLREIFGDLTLRDAAKPLLVACYDAASGAPLVFSRADAAGSGARDFKIRHVCEATCAGPAAVGVKSTDGTARISAVGGVRNPTAAAITHVLNNKREFPHAAGVEDLLVLSLGGGRESAPPDIAAIAAAGMSETVDQAVAMAFGHCTASNYLRIEANGFRAGTEKGMEAVAEALLSERNVESVMFRGSKVSDRTNGEKLEWFAGELIREQERRARSTTTTTASSSGSSSR